MAQICREREIKDTLYYKWRQTLLETSENNPEAIALVREIAEEVGAEVLVTDDLASYQDMADGFGLDHQICRKHVQDKVGALAGDLFAQLTDEERLHPKWCG